MVNSLIEAFGYRGCPICLKLEKDEYDFMCRWQNRTLKEAETRRDLVSAGGYCNFHFYEMARLVSPLANAVVAKDLIDKEIEETEKRTFRSISRIDCPVCGYLGEREGSYLKEFMTFLRESTGQKEYEKTDGLCLVHMEKALNLLGGNDLSQFLVHTQMSQLRNLKEELQDFISKGGKASRRMGKEKNSWWVSIQKWVGRKGLPEPP